MNLLLHDKLEISLNENAFKGKTASDADLALTQSQTSKRSQPLARISAAPGLRRRMGKHINQKTLDHLTNNIY